MRRRITVVFLLLVCGAIVAGVSLRPAYRHFKEQSALKHARQFLARGNLQAASLSARQALAINPTNLQAFDIMARVAEACWPPQALDWRRRIATLAPTIENKLSYAATALRVQSPPFQLASDTLEELRPVATNRVAYCNLQADLAIKLNNHAQAERWIEAASRLEPANELHRFNLAVLWLNQTNPHRPDEARTILHHLEANPNFSVLALRCLVLDRLGAGDLPEAEQLADKLDLEPRATMQDHLVGLDILYKARLPRFNSRLEETQNRLATNPAAIYELSSFLVRHGMAEQARGWLQKQPRALQQIQPIPLALVECSIDMEDWSGVERLLENAPWGDFEPIRLAFLSQAAFELHDPAAAESRWRLATSLARGRLGSLMWLAARAESWGRAKARLDLLWEISRQFPCERWTLDDLARAYLAGGNTRELHEVCARLSALVPTDLSSRNDFATTAFLLKTNLAQAHEIARGLFAEHPQDPVVVSTYAYSLHLQGRTKEALALIESLSAETLSRPALAPYYGAILRANGQIEKASACCARAEHADLLPEERELLRSP